MIRCARSGLFPGGFPGPAGANAPVDSGGSGTVPAKGPNTSVFFRHGLSMGKNMWDYRAPPSVVRGPDPVRFADLILVWRGCVIIWTGCVLVSNQIGAGGRYSRERGLRSRSSWSSICCRPGCIWRMWASWVCEGSPRPAHRFPPRIQPLRPMPKLGSGTRWHSRREMRCACAAPQLTTGSTEERCIGTRLGHGASSEPVVWRVW